MDQTPMERPAVRGAPRDLFGRVIAILLLVLLVLVVGGTYVGHSPGPYGTCYGTSGRSIPCELVARAKLGRT